MSAAPSKHKTPAEAAATITVEKNKIAEADTEGDADVEPTPDIPKTKRDDTHLASPTMTMSPHTMGKNDEGADDDADGGNFIAIFITKLPFCTGTAMSR